jgi:hypothetical protein
VRRGQGRTPRHERLDDTEEVHLCDQPITVGAGSGTQTGRQHGPVEHAAGRREHLVCGGPSSGGVGEVGDDVGILEIDADDPVTACDELTGCL